MQHGVLFEIIFDSCHIDWNCQNLTHRAVIVYFVSAIYSFMVENLTFVTYCPI